MREEEERPGVGTAGVLLPGVPFSSAGKGEKEMTF